MNTTNTKELTEDLFSMKKEPNTTNLEANLSQFEEIGRDLTTVDPRKTALQELFDDASKNRATFLEGINSLDQSCEKTGIHFKHQIQNIKEEGEKTLFRSLEIETINILSGHTNIAAVPGEFFKEIFEEEIDKDHGKSHHGHRTQEAVESVFKHYNPTKIIQWWDENIGDTEAKYWEETMGTIVKELEYGQGIYRNWEKKEILELPEPGKPFIFGSSPWEHCYDKGYSSTCYDSRKTFVPFFKILTHITRGTTLSNIPDYYPEVFTPQYYEGRHTHKVKDSKIFKVHKNPIPGFPEITAIRFLKATRNTTITLKPDTHRKLVAEIKRYFQTQKSKE